MEDHAALRKTLEIVQSELKGLAEERLALDAMRAALELKIANREDFIRSGTQLLSEAEPRGRQQSNDLPEEHTDPLSAILAFPRDGYGAVTRAVDHLLDSNPEGYSARQLAETLERGRFVVKESHEDAVRSAIKNLRIQGKVVHNALTGRYQSTKHAKMAASA